jgi:hypothetical protein
MIFKKDLMALKKDIRVIGKKVENLLKAFEKDVKVKAPKASKAKAVKATTAKKAPIKKKVTKVTATDKVLKIINRSKKGVDIATLKKKTGFEDKSSIDQRRVSISPPSKKRQALKIRSCGI